MADEVFSVTEKAPSVASSQHGSRPATTTSRPATTKREAGTPLSSTPIPPACSRPVTTTPEADAEPEREPTTEEVMELFLVDFWDDVFECVGSAEVDKNANVYASQCAWEAMMEMVDWYHIMHDEGESPAFVETNLAWKHDEEPALTPADAHCRGVVPVRRRKTPSLPSPVRETAAPTTTNSRSPSVEGTKPRNMRRSVFGDDIKRHAKNLTNEIEDEATQMARLELEKRREKTKKAKDLLDSYAADDARYEQMVAALRGKNFVFDSHGQPIMLVVSETDASRAKDVGIRIEQMEVQEEEKPKPRGKGAARSKAKGQKSNEELGYTEAKSLQAPLINTISLKPGVTLSENGGTRVGPKLDEQPNRMSKKEFKRQCQQHNENETKQLSETQKLELERAEDMAASMLVEPTEGDMDSKHVGGGSALVRVENGIPQLPAEAMPEVFTAFSPRELPFANMELSPLKPTAKDQAKAIGPRPRMPRTRPFLEQSQGRLPKPMYPATSGHGFVTSYLAVENQFAHMDSPTKNSTYQRNFPQPVHRIQRNTRLREDHEYFNFSETPQQQSRLSNYPS